MRDGARKRWFVEDRILAKLSDRVSSLIWIGSLFGVLWKPRLPRYLAQFFARHLMTGEPRNQFWDAPNGRESRGERLARPGSMARGPSTDF
ncbi:MAG: hypothetical protein EB020_13145 [Proteobacteria bacterium]|nr:hypothetical protein [Pseudomonadota bacterium]NDE06291.1 hypothetical protein [Chloroflexota bacterium]